MEQLDKSVDLLCRLIRTPSFSGEEAAAVDILVSHLQNQQLDIQRFSNNLIVRYQDYSPDKPDLLLNSHIDTVKPVNGWQRDPFAAVVEGQRIYGLGSNDAGGCLVTLVATFLSLREQQLPFNLVLVVSAEEERSGPNGLRSLLSQIREPLLAIVGEPTTMRMAVAERGLMVLDCLAKGRAGHAARDNGINAIDIAIEDIRWFHQYRFDVAEDEQPVRMTATMISAGTQHNVIPDICEFVVDVRTAGHWRNQQVLEVIEKATRSQAKARSTRLQPSALPQQHFARLSAKALGIETFASDTLSDQALMPWPSIKIGPGQSQRSHTADEYISIDEIAGGLKGYERLILQLAKDFNI